MRHAIIAMPEVAHSVRRQAVELSRVAGLQLLTVPVFDDLMSGKVTVSEIRNVELDDLLGRDPVVLDTAGLMSWISGHAVMVTAAGGSIGSDMCRQIARYRPRQIILYELNELALYNIEQEFTARFRPGEKLYEEPLAASESTLPTPHPKLRVARAASESADWLAELNIWLESNIRTDTAAVKGELARRVPDYTPQHAHEA
jgi:FlaA1/EpsC-like NDP-sugar epimerase